MTSPATSTVTTSTTPTLTMTTEKPPTKIEKIAQQALPSSPQPSLLVPVPIPVKNITQAEKQDVPIDDIMQEVFQITQSEEEPAKAPAQKILKFTESEEKDVIDLMETLGGRTQANIGNWKQCIVELKTFVPPPKINPDQENIERKINLLVYLIAQKCGFDSTKFIKHLDTITTKVRQWEPLEGDFKKSKDQNLLQEAKTTIQKMQTLGQTFLQWQKVFEKNLNSLTKTVPALGAFASDFNEYKTKYTDITTQELVPLINTWTDVMEKMGDRIREDKGYYTPSDSSFQTFSNCHDIKVKKSKENVSDYHARTKELESVKNESVTAQTAMNGNIDLFRLYYNGVYYHAVDKKCQYSAYTTWPKFRGWHALGYYNYIDDAEAVKKPPNQNIDGEDSEEGDKKEEKVSSSSSSNSSGLKHSSSGYVDISLAPTPRVSDKGDGKASTSSTAQSHQGPSGSSTSESQDSNS